MENIHTDPQEAYRKRQFAAQARKTLSTIDIGKAEQSESPEGVVGIRIVKDPVRSFLKERGFHGDPKIDYSVVIKTENIDNVETVHFTAFNDLKNFLTGNADRIVSKPDQIAYEIDYDPSVYEWSEGLPHEESQSLIEAWDKLGRDIMMDADKKAEDPPATDKEASKEKTQKKLEEVRAELGIPTSPEVEEKVPTDRRGLITYFRANFEKMDTAPLEEFKKMFTPEVKKRYGAYVSALLQNIISEKSYAHTRYPDTTAGVFGGDLGMLIRIVNLKENRAVSFEELSSEPFSVVAKKYLNIDIPQDYFDHFSKK